MKLIIQIPCFNEEMTLPQTIADLPKSIEGIDEIEYLIINDGSTDDTVEVAKGLGVNHIVNLIQNKGLAQCFLSGIDACLHLGADIIVNTDADNQYCGDDICKLVIPILQMKADIVIGQRPIDETDHFSWNKKMLQHFGSFVVRLASNTDVPDATSGFRAYSREAALRINVINEYTYTLETIIQAGRNNGTIISVPIHTNPDTRKSRLFSNMWTYILRSVVIIVRSFMMYKPLRFFGVLGMTSIVTGVVLGIRFLIYYINGYGAGHIQSLILVAILILLGVQAVIAGLQADLVASNRKILEDIQYRIRSFECEQSSNMDRSVKYESSSARRKLF
ncbi:MULTISPECIES: glycosyltransferase family 2 protein [unclassified Fusibacter]|uniref:glycosyltransferase family 2 protein n=1 Tax=unclassified Fusibacter TaxID=2624464 RepID=UPI0010124E3E|nr:MULTISPECIES: glycosyltransferase family 2 protein [unclassified Fusibacter]MCK8059986.1 glycosyltransferase family 2 protein [Fusibacter sp. A2]NPE22126.1 glycosyltransferase family 2 protein [Fusibacter sp. A1]RXV60904.1 glycosyltransferase family 2 protein [Fusibacter sp. A1]